MYIWTYQKEEILATSRSRPPTSQEDDSFQSLPYYVIVAQLSDIHDRHKRRGLEVRCLLRSEASVTRLCIHRATYGLFCYHYIKGLHAPFAGHAVFA